MARLWYTYIKYKGINSNKAALSPRTTGFPFLAELFGVAASGNSARLQVPLVSHYSVGKQSYRAQSSIHK
jgi:hypothetical protein